jgi:hypothetical protein
MCCRSTDHRHCSRHYRHRPSHRCCCCHRCFPSRWCHRRYSGVAYRIPPQKRSYRRYRRCRRYHRCRHCHHHCSRRFDVTVET